MPDGLVLLFSRFSSRHHVAALRLTVFASALDARLSDLGAISMTCLICFTNHSDGHRLLGWAASARCTVASDALVRRPRDHPSAASILGVVACIAGLKLRMRRGSAGQAEDGAQPLAVLDRIDRAPKRRESLFEGKAEQGAGIGPLRAMKATDLKPRTAPSNGQSG